MHGKGVAVEGLDNTFGERSFENIGAWVVGRNSSVPDLGVCSYPSRTKATSDGRRINFEYVIIAHIINATAEDA